VTVKEALGQAREVLAANNIEDASLESELLLRHALGVDRVQLYLAFDDEFGAEKEAVFRKLIGRCLNGEPTAYIVRHREFYGLDFHVDARVLIPRPESELLVEKALELAQSRGIATIAEIGTGCGAIAISLAVKLPQIKVYATDISGPALEVASFNCRKHGVAGKISLLQGNLLEPLYESVDLIIANLPYVRELEISRGGLANFEPELALSGGSDGLEKIRQLCQQAGSKLNPEGGLLLEIGQGQETPVTTYLRSLFPSAAIAVSPDLSGIERVVSLCLTPYHPSAKLV